MGGWRAHGSICSAASDIAWPEPARGQQRLFLHAAVGSGVLRAGDRQTVSARPEEYGVRSSLDLSRHDRRAGGSSAEEQGFDAEGITGRDEKWLGNLGVTQIV